MKINLDATTAALVTKDLNKLSDKEVWEIITLVRGQVMLRQTYPDVLLNRATQPIVSEKEKLEKKLEKLFNKRDRVEEDIQNCINAIAELDG